jgi:hypothetical protein
MKHATPAVLDTIEPLLERIRALPLKEKSRGIFYLKSRAFLHFHEDPQGLFADIRAEDGKDFDRLQVDDPAAREDLVAKARSRCGA